ncbi:extracellular solute-binding protein [Acetobacter oeni]|uniref:ABC transporter n=1 Tax=Acetobacter oeni TaxID=304077 RepID=A0A511XI60_9PROT|nr:extracellular solute-binding protein [Acetobacter oeni]MBB3883046.1 putative spermidine/putrescine transport system substrate-binding protein [Acetobacter oeni]GBR11563.1 spermidine/putrescine-binding periplasmic protein [Acetobacter oeni LMG 21952]GEN62630.1 ABC transporter [Acetobacter oeni]
MNDIFWQPFTRITGQRITTIIRNNDLTTLEKKTGTPQRSWSLALTEDEVAQAGCNDGAFLSSDTDAADPATRESSSCNVPAFSLDFTLAWDTSRFRGKPDWKDFWDVARHPGKRGLRADPRGTLEAALLSDGVPPDAIYRVLSTPEGVNRAFRRLNQLRPYIVWWTAPGDAMRILTTGAALMGVAATADVFITNSKHPNPGFGLLPSSIFYINYDWVIPAGTMRGEAAAQALRTWIIKPEQRETFSSRISLLTENRNNRDPDASHESPASLFSNSFWRDHLPALQEQFRQWLAEH